MLYGFALRVYSVFKIFPLLLQVSMEFIHLSSSNPFEKIPILISIIVAFLGQPVTHVPQPWVVRERILMLIVVAVVGAQFSSSSSRELVPRQSGPFFWMVFSPRVR